MEGIRRRWYQTFTVYGALTDKPTGLVSGMSGAARFQRP